MVWAFCAGRKVVVKVFRTPMEAMSPAVREEADKEVELMKMLVHPNVVKFYSSFIHEDRLHIVME